MSRPSHTFTTIEPRPRWRRLLSQYLFVIGGWLWLAAGAVAWLLGNSPDVAIICSVVFFVGAEIDDRIRSGR